jgi:YHS domain-containing protein
MEIIPIYSIEHEYKGKKYYFCAQSCVKDFKIDPEKYLAEDHVKTM